MRGTSGTAEPQIDRAVVVEHRGRRRRGREIVGRYDHHEAGERTGQRDVFDAHLGCPVLADRDARVAADDLDVEPGISDRHPELVVGIAHDECGEAGDHARLARRRQPRGDPDQVALGNTDIKETVRVFLAEPFRSGGVAHVAIDDDDARIVVSQRFECTPKRVAGRLAQLSFRL